MTSFETFAKEYKGKKVLIFGLGIQGRGLGDAKIFCEIGSDVKITDKKNEAELESSMLELKSFEVSYTLGQHTKEDIEWADVIIRNASVPWNHDLLEYARSLGKSIKMDAALFFEYANSEKTIGVTGTRGKTTTSNLIYQIIKQSGLSVTLGGNGVAIASLELLKQYDPEMWYVFELSSWQLQAFHQEKISPHVGVLTNYYPDHLLDRSYDDYKYDKTSIFAYQSEKDIAILNAHNEDIQKLVIPEAVNIAYFEADDVASEWTPKLVGVHNKDNIAAAIAVAGFLGIDESVVKNVIESFETLPYRLQKVAEIDGVTFINDTTSTTPIATIRALEAYPNAILIMGGNTKNLPVAELIGVLNSKTKKIIFLEGTGTDQLIDKINPELIIGKFNDFKQAFNSATANSTNGDIIMLSPAFFSFGMFKNEFDRGDQFNVLVKEL